MGYNISVGERKTVNELCVYVSVHVCSTCVSVCVHIFKQVHMEAEINIGCLSCLHPTIFFETGSLVHLISWPAHDLQGFSCLQPLPTSTEVPDLYHCAHKGAGDPNASPRVCTVGALLPEPSPQPWALAF